MFSIKSLVLAAILSLAALSATAKTGSTPYTNTEGAEILQASELRMQSQRLTKLYLQIPAKLESDTAKRELRQGQEAFDRTLQRLQSNVAQPRQVSVSLRKVNRLWREYSRLLDEKFDTRRLPEMMSLSNELYQACSNLANALSSASESSLDSIVDLSLRQGTLSQRLAMLYVVQLHQKQSTSMQVEIEQSRIEFANAMKSLRDSTVNTSSIKQNLELARIQWNFFEEALRTFDASNAYHPKNVATTSERILQVMTEVALAYETALRVQR